MAGGVPNPDGHLHARCRTEGWRGEDGDRSRRRRTGGPGRRPRRRPGAGVAARRTSASQTSTGRRSVRACPHAGVPGDARPVLGDEGRRRPHPSTDVLSTTTPPAPTHRPQATGHRPRAAGRGPRTADGGRRAADGGRGCSAVGGSAGDRGCSTRAGRVHPGRAASYRRGRRSPGPRAVVSSPARTGSGGTLPDRTGRWRTAVTTTAVARRTTPPSRRIAS